RGRARALLRRGRAGLGPAPPGRGQRGRPATDARCRIRPARGTDLAQVRAIEEQIFSDPWSLGDFRESLAAGIPFLVAVTDAEPGDVAGYAIAHAAADEGEILNLGVASQQRRRGIARALVDAVLEELGTRGVRTVFLEVRDSNSAARRLYAQRGFREVGRRSRYYRQPVEDAVVLRAAISAAASRA